jgi:chromate transporter
LSKLFLVWARISVESFGGGSSTLLLMRREFVAKQRWFTTEEYGDYWSISQMSPGIVLLAMSIMMGRELRGTRGLLVSLTGILLPSAAITILLTAGFTLVQTLRPAQAMIQGIVPATSGIMLYLAVQFARPQIQQSIKAGPVRIVEGATVIVGSASALIYWHVEPILVLLGAVLACVGLFLPLEMAVQIANQTGRVNR